jgi:CheY-like chemotaxis protein
MKIWVVDDNEGLRNIIGRVAAGLGVEVDNFGNGAQLCAALERGDPRPDSMFVDILMPEMDGIELVRRLGDARVGCPLIFMTGGPYVLAEAAMTMAEARDLNVQGLMTKPIPVEKLRSTIAALG